MSRDIINAPALHRAVDEAFEDLPPVFVIYRAALRAYFRQVAADHACVRVAHRRKGDPPWAQEKFAAGHTLFRFKEQARVRLIGEIRDHLDGLRQVAELASRLQGPCARDAAAFLRGLPHRRSNIRSVRQGAWELGRRAKIAILRTRRHEVLRTSLQISAGPLLGRRCVSLDEIIKVGRKARNCLAARVRYWQRFVSSESDFWLLYDRDRLMAVLEVTQNTVTEAEGPCNRAIDLRDVRSVALLCQTAGFEIGEGCKGLMPDYAAPFTVAPTLVVLTTQVALYAEWPTAVRIDMSSERSSFTSSRGQTDILVLTFDPERSMAAAVLGGRDPRGAVERFGRKKLRKIVRSIALDHATPTLVQHRLLAIAA